MLNNNFFGTGTEGKILKGVFGFLFGVIAVMIIGFFIASIFAVNAQDELTRVSPLPPIVALEQTPPPTDATPPLTNVGQLFTPEIILALVFLLTLPLTTLVKKLFRLEGNTANIVSNVILNALAKGLVLVSTGQSTIGFAIIATLLGIVLDKSIYDLLTQGKQQKIQQLEKDVLKPEPYGDGDYSRQP